MNNKEDIAIKAMNNINSYCYSILNRPYGTYCADTVVMAEVVSSYVQEGLRALKDE